MTGMVTVYHGGTEVVEHPICDFGRPNLDFGRGFYLTDMRQQAEAWARVVADRRKAAPVINVYLLDKETILRTAQCKLFDAYDRDWLDFIVASRKGQTPYSIYDYVEGGVANDRVVDTVNLFMAGLMDSDTALRRLAMHKPNNQICLINQTLTDKYLRYERTDIL